MNRDRDVLGLPALVASQALDDAARLRAEDMLIRGYLGAIGPGDTSVAAQELMAVAGYSGRLGELVYEHLGPLSTLTESTIGAWMASDAHRKLLLDTRFQFLGERVGGRAGGVDRRRAVRRGGTMSPRSQPMDNRTLAETFEAIADLLEIQGEIIHKVLAYRRAAESIRGLTRRGAEVPNICVGNIPDGRARLAARADAGIGFDSSLVIVALARRAR